MLAITGVALAEGSVPGVVLDSSGFAVEEARVALQLDDLCVEFVFTDAEGQYLFEDVTAGLYTIKASKRREGNGQIEDVEVFDGEVTEVDDITLITGGQGGGQGGGHGGHKQAKQGGRR